MLKKVTLAILIAGGLMLSACNTVKGLGRDIESVGKSGEDAIN
jgi:predicted small secreted protein